MTEQPRVLTADRGGDDARSSARRTDRFDAARAVADATLYEGYLLYPYRATALKNRLRWQFGVLAPPAWAEETGAERSALTTECLAEVGPASVLHVRVRFLQLQRRTVEARTPSGFVEVDSLATGAVTWVPWDEAIERVVDLPPCPVGSLGPAPWPEAFEIEAGSSDEPIVDDDASVGRARRTWERLAGMVTVAVSGVDDADGEGLVTLTVTVASIASTPRAGASRDDVLGRSLLGVHTLLALDEGRFVSLVDPPPAAEEAAARCRNDGTFPVLVADPVEGGDVVLSSPITLYDHPEVAPESQGDLYDATEIDEILALRVLTLTAEEKALARGTDPRAGEIVDRCDDMAPEAWARLHGTMRDVEPGPTDASDRTDGPPPTERGFEPVTWWTPEADAAVDPWRDTVVVEGRELGQGAKVVLRPRRRADAHDLFLQGMVATVAGVFVDVDGSRHVAVTVDDDPANDVLSEQGRYLYFFSDEIEPLR